ncbi:MAG: hypothetical protein VXV78_10000, partial [Pseudomonadota bacterium]|nr:hypothetical protein [Pseudomonadota bacterium]
GTTALKRKVNPARVPIEQKESMRWLDNLRLSCELTGAPERCVHISLRFKFASERGVKDAAPHPYCCGEFG